MKKIDLIEIVPIVLCMAFAIVISLYHVSFEGYLGLSNKVWGSVWAIAENGFSLMLCWLVSVYSVDVIRIVFRWVFMPYFALKLIYHFSCYSDIYLLEEELWRNIWAVACICLLIVSIVYCLILIRKRHV